MGLLFGVPLVIQMIAFLTGLDAKDPLPFAAIALTGVWVVAIRHQRNRAKRGRTLARELRSPQCAAEALSQSKYLGWNGTVHSFDFASKPYALAFMRLNLSKLVNLTTEARKALDPG